MQLERTHVISYGNTEIAYDLSFSRRKTLAIHVYPDGRVSVRAPEGSRLETIAGLVARRAGWIVRQQQRFSSYPPAVAVPREYISGESYRYLGRQYRLKVLDGAPEQLALGRTEIYVTARNQEPQRVQRLLERWYRAEARRVFSERLAACWPRVAHLDCAFPVLNIRRMKTRWGSCGRSGRILLNLRLIQAPIESIDYVIVHELCHLKEHNHSKRFYALLDTAMPDWRERRQRLNAYEFVEQ
jgi:predicted metal-dependent hydrolase